MAAYLLGKTPLGMCLSHAEVYRYAGKSATRADEESELWRVPPEQRLPEQSACTAERVGARGTGFSIPTESGLLVASVAHVDRPVASIALPQGTRRDVPLRGVA